MCSAVTTKQLQQKKIKEQLTANLFANILTVVFVFLLLTRSEIASKYFLS
jgi:hypothetical protein